MPRSGTTLIFEAFAQHVSLGWPSNYTEYLPKAPWLNVITRFVRNRFVTTSGRKGQYGRTPLGNRLLPKPAEAYTFWDYYSETDFARAYLEDELPTPEVSERLREAVTKILYWQGREQFAAKLTGPSRMAFLRAAFPDARFVHVIRDGRAVTHSLLRVGFWKQKGGLKGAFWKGGLPQASLDVWEDSGRDAGVLAAIQWSHVVRATRAAGSAMGPESYTEVRYEDFVAAPEETTSALYAFCGLPQSSAASEFLSRGPALENMNHKYLADFDPLYVEKLTKIMELEPTKLDYSI
jgi:hypothetical protein